MTPSQFTRDFFKIRCQLIITSEQAVIMLTYFIFAPLALFLVVRIYWLSNHYLQARKHGLPIVILPVSFDDMWWIPLRPLFSWVEKLPFGLGSWYVYTEMGWPTIDGMRTVERLGENFVLVSPFGVQVISYYAPGVETAFRESRNWIAPESQGRLFAFYGENVSSTNLSEWQRHRKIISSAFNEHTHRKVWTESVRRARDLDFSDPVRTLSGIRSTFDVLAMHVLAVVGFDHESVLTSVPPGHRESLMESLGFILKNIVLTILFNSLTAPDFLLPKLLRRLKVSVAEFRLYMEESVLHQMRQSNTTKGDPTSLLGALVSANEAEKQQLQKPVGRPSYLTESELYGNIFVFNLAGFETTASSFAFALSYLAVHPELQDWVVEEIEKNFSTSPDSTYDELFNKLPRCLAVMHETLRLASPAPLLIRSPLKPTELPVMTERGRSNITIPPTTAVGCHFYGAHLSPCWGPDVNQFNPKRFITSVDGHEKVEVPPGVFFIPWSLGSRICPAKKFSQIEFVAVLAQLLSEYRLEILVRNGESYSDARARTMSVVSEKYFNVSAHFIRPEDAGIRLCRR